MGCTVDGCTVYEDILKGTLLLHLSLRPAQNGCGTVDSASARKHLLVSVPQRTHSSNKEHLEPLSGPRTPASAKCTHSHSFQLSALLIPSGQHVTYFAPPRHTTPACTLPPFPAPIPRRSARAGGPVSIPDAPSHSLISWHSGHPARIHPCTQLSLAHSSHPVTSLQSGRLRQPCSKLPVSRSLPHALPTLPPGRSLPRPTRTRPAAVPRTPPRTQHSRATRCPATRRRRANWQP